MTSTAHMYRINSFLSICPGQMSAGSSGSGWLVVITTIWPGVSTSSSRTFSRPERLSSSSCLKKKDGPKSQVSCLWFLRWMSSSLQNSWQQACRQGYSLYNACLFYMSYLVISSKTHRALHKLHNLSIITSPNNTTFRPVSYFNQHYHGAIRTNHRDGQESMLVWMK